MGQICKGTIASISGNTARIVPYDEASKPTAKITIPWHLRGKTGDLKKGTVVIYAEYDDTTGLLLGRADGEWGEYLPKLDADLITADNINGSSGGGTGDGTGGNPGGDSSSGGETVDLEAMLKEVDERFDSIEKRIDDLHYEAITITAFSNNANPAENGATINDVVLSWTFSKKPAEVMLDGVAQSTGASGATLSDLGITSKKTWTLEAKDERGAVAKKETVLNFYDGVYYGMAAKPASVDSAFIKSLSGKKLSSGKNLTVSVKGGEGLFFWYAYPKSMGASKFNIGGFDYEYEAETISFENQYGVKKDYYVYVSGQEIPDNISVTVKGG